MAERITLALWEPVSAYQSLKKAWEYIKPMLIAGRRLVLEVRPEKRSDAQNRRLWAMLADISAQVDWHGQKLASEDWKHVFTASLKQQRAVPGLDGGFVVLGQSTSKMTKAEMAELQELMEAFGAQQGVRFTAPESEDVR